MTAIGVDLLDCLSPQSAAGQAIDCVSASSLVRTVIHDRHCVPCCVHNSLVVQSLVRSENGTESQDASPRGKIVSDRRHPRTKNAISDLRGERSALRSVCAYENRHVDGVPVEHLDDGTVPDGFLTPKQAPDDSDIMLPRPPSASVVGPRCSGR